MTEIVALPSQRYTVRAVLRGPGGPVFLVDLRAMLDAVSAAGATA